jgi:methionyl aminopeptidase
VNEQVVHGIPSDRKLKKGDIVSVDIGSLVDGFYGDVAYTFPVGEISRGTKKLVSVTLKAMERAIKGVKPGNHIGDVSFEVEDEARINNFSVVRDLFGHGIGKNLHEDPLIPNFGKKGEGPELRAGMIFAIEPMLNIGSSKIKTLSDGWTVVTWDKTLSCHFEHTVLVTKKGVEVLTSWPKIKMSLN